MLHPGTNNVAFFSSAALATCNIEFKGRPAHAAASPWEGNNTLDALVLAHSAVGLVRQQLLPSDRIHGIITNGGKAFNIIPDYCAAMYAVRSPDPLRVKQLQEKLENCFRGAEVATGTNLTIEWTRTLNVNGDKIAGLNVHSNRAIAGRFQQYMSTQYGTQFSLDGGLLANASTVFFPDYGVDG
jgi:metal-dependent amidase/aminoacylase/carboxypeptidase family protein